MILTTKEKWVVDKLKRNGYKADYHDYSPDEMLVYKSLSSCNQSFDWTNTLLFYISKRKGCRIEFRHWEHEALHLVHYFAWPTIKNWHTIDEFETFCRKFSWERVMNNQNI